MRFYGLSDREVMSMPVRRFTSLYRAMEQIALEEEAQALSIHHNGKPGDRMKEILSKLRGKDVDVGDMPVQAMVLMNTPGISVEREPGYIEQLRARQKASAERLKAEYYAERNAKQSEQSITSS